jgi:hypothetical protein
MKDVWEKNVIYQDMQYYSKFSRQRSREANLYVVGRRERPSLPSACVPTKHSVQMFRIE